VNGELIVVDDVAGEFAERVIEAFHNRPGEGFSMALSGGDTARRCYERLAADGGDQIDWWQVDVYWGDERCVPPDDHDSKRVAQLGHFDLVHLGLGPDGHTASLFPGSAALDADEGRLVVMNEDPRGNNPHPRMTLTFSAIARSRLVLVTASGEGRRWALAAVCNGEDVPAARIRADRVVWLADREAAAGL